jgi:hypothetical protein
MTLGAHISAAFILDGVGLVGVPNVLTNEYRETTNCKEASHTHSSSPYIRWIQYSLNTFVGYIRWILRVYIHLAYPTSTHASWLARGEQLATLTK